MVIGWDDDVVVWWCCALVGDRVRCACREGVGVSFFFQAEDGIRDTSVTGVQTCALPI